MRPLRGAARVAKAVRRVSRTAVDLIRAALRLPEWSRGYHRSGIRSAGAVRRCSEALPWAPSSGLVLGLIPSASSMVTRGSKPRRSAAARDFCEMVKMLMAPVEAPQTAM